MKGSTLDVGEDRLVLDVPQKNFHLNLSFPHLVDYESGGAQYNRKTKVRQGQVILFILYNKILHS